MSLLSKIFSPYWKPEGKHDAFETINDAIVEGRELTEQEERRVIVSTAIRMERHERVCMIRGGSLILGVAYLCFEKIKKWPMVEQFLRFLW